MLYLVEGYEQRPGEPKAWGWSRPAAPSRARDLPCCMLRGKLLLDISSRILCPHRKTREVGHNSNREFHGLSGDQRFGAFQRFARERYCRRR